MDGQIMMNINVVTVAVYKLRMCKKEDNPSPKHIKGDNSMEIIICV